jgi:hypothetical protein
MHTTFLLEILMERDRPEDLGVGGRIIFEWILWKLGFGFGLDWIHFALDKAWLL